MAHAHIIYSGHLRTFAKTWRNHAYFIWRHFDSVQITLSLEDEDDIEERTDKILQDGLSDWPCWFTFKRQPDFSEWNNHPSQHLAPYALSVPPAAVVGQLWHLEKAFNFATEDKFENRKPDCYIRMRTDSWFQNGIELIREVERLMNFPFNANPKAALIPYWGNFGGVNDRFAILGCFAAQSYFTTYSRIEEYLKLGCPLHPESLIRESLLECNIHRAAIMFSTLRENGEMRWPEILAYEQPNH